MTRGARGSGENLGRAFPECQPAPLCHRACSVLSTNQKTSAVDSVQAQSSSERGLGVRVVLFLILGACAALPVVFLGLREARRWVDYEVAAADRETRAAAQSLAGEIGVSMTAYLRALNAVAAQIEALGAIDGQAAREALSAHSDNHPEFVGAYLATADGVALVHYQTGGGYQPGGTQYRDRDYFREILETDRAAISRVQVGRVTKVTGVQIAAPIHDAHGELVGIICNAIDLGPVAIKARRVAQGLGEGRVVVIDGEGRIIADSAQVLAGPPREVSGLRLFEAVEGFEARIGVDDHGQEVRSAVVAVGDPVRGWRVVAMKPKLAVQRQAQEIQTQAAMLFVGLLIAALAVAAIAAAWLGRPLRALAYSAERVTQGDYQHDFGATGGPREFRLLASSVRAMVRALRAHTENLQGLVRERTQQLESANKELAEALKQVRRGEQAMLADIEQARLFQQRVLPSLPAADAVQFAALYLPLERIGGDIYDVYQLAPGRFRMFVADATGHGVQASLRTIMLKVIYDRIKTSAVNTVTALQELNRRLIDELPDEEHCAAVCVDVELTEGGARVRYCIAGGSPLFHYSGSSGQEVYIDGPLLGVTSTASWPDEQVLDLRPGDLLLICSDGLVEQRNPEQAYFDQSLPSLALAGARHADDALNELSTRFHAFRGDQKVEDDVTVIAVKLPLAL